MAKHRTPKHNPESSGLQAVVAGIGNPGCPVAMSRAEPGSPIPATTGSHKHGFPSLIPELANLCFARICGMLQISRVSRSLWLISLLVLITPSEAGQPSDSFAVSAIVAADRCVE